MSDEQKCAEGNKAEQHTIHGGDTTTHHANGAVLSRAIPPYK